MKNLALMFIGLFAFQNLGMAQSAINQPGIHDKDPVSPYYIKRTQDVAEGKVSFSWCELKDGKYDCSIDLGCRPGYGLYSPAELEGYGSYLNYQGHKRVAGLVAMFLGGWVIKAAWSGLAAAPAAVATTGGTTTAAGTTVGGAIAGETSSIAAAPELLKGAGYAVEKLASRAAIVAGLGALGFGIRSYVERLVNTIDPIRKYDQAHTINSEIYQMTGDPGLKNLKDFRVELHGVLCDLDRVDWKPLPAPTLESLIKVPPPYWPYLPKVQQY